MSTTKQAVSIAKDQYTLRGKLLQSDSGIGIARLKVIAWDHDAVGKHDQLGEGITNSSGEFEIRFSRKQFSESFFDRKPDLFLEVFDGSALIKSTVAEIIKNADGSTAPILILLPFHQNLNNMIAPNQCTVFIQVWVDVNALQQDSTAGCYAVSNRSQDSTGEGTANLVTNVITGSNVCWAVVPIDPQYNGDFSITGVGAQSGWATPPAPVAGSPNLFTGQLTTATVGGNVDSNIVFSFNGGGEAITVTVPITITPVQE